MNKSEIALEITLKAMEHDAIRFQVCSGQNDELEQFNAFNVKQVADFYNTLLKQLSSEA